MKNDDIHQKCNILKNKNYLKPLNTCKKHFETILLNWDECKIQGKYTMV